MMMNRKPILIALPIGFALWLGLIQLALVVL